MPPARPACFVLSLSALLVACGISTAGPAEQGRQRPVDIADAGIPVQDVLPRADGGGVWRWVSGLQQGSQHVAANRTHVYWTSVASHDVRRFSDADRGVYRVATTGSNPGALALDATYVYWVLGDQPGPGLWRAPLLNGPAEPVGNTGPITTTRLVSHGDFLYWSDADGLERLSRAGGDVQTVLATAGLTTAPVFSGDEAWVGAGATILRVALSGAGTPSTWATFDDGVLVELALDETHLWALVRAERAGGCAYSRLVRMPRAGGPPETVGGHIGRCGRDLQVDARAAYWLGTDKRGEAMTTLVRVDKVLGRSEALFTGMAFTWRLAQDDVYLYWAEPETGDIRRVQKP